MKDEVKRIIRMVQEGKLSPEDAAELIDAFSNGEGATAEPAGEAAGAVEGEGSVPPPSEEAAADPSDKPKDPFRQFVEALERAGKEATESVNWSEVAKQVRSGAQKGLEQLKVAVDQVGKGKFEFNLGWLNGAETKQVILPLALPAGKALRIENAVGDVKVVGGFEVGSVTAHAKFRNGSAEELRRQAEAYTLLIEESDHLVQIKQPDVAGLTVDLEVQVPTGASVEIRAETGDLKVVETQGPCRISSRTGDINLRGLNGPVEVSANSGDVRLEDVKSPSVAIENKSGDLHLTRVVGNLNVRTASGDVVAKQVSGKTLSLESVSGDVYVDLSEPASGTLNVRTVHGDATLAISDGSDARVSLSTLRGTVQCDLPLEDEARTDQRITGRLGEGTGTLDVSAVSGDVTLQLRDQVTE